MSARNKGDNRAGAGAVYDNDWNVGSGIDAGGHFQIAGRFLAGGSDGGTQGECRALGKGRARRTPNENGQQGELS
jgi:hypothetical protein